LVVLLVAAACTNKGGTATPARAATGGTLRVAISQPGSLDPANAYEPAGRLVDSLLCEPLLTVDPATGKLRPGLATNWVVSAGGTRITLRLRTARFSNGQRVTSDDVIAELSRAASEDFAGNAAKLLSPIDGWPEISGAKDTANSRDRRVLRGLTAIDASSLAITLDHRDADFLHVLAHPVAAPVPRKLAAGDVDAFSARPVCAGPYQLADKWTPGQSVIRLIRNPDYHGRNPVFSNGGRGYADTVEFHTYGNAEAVFGAWQKGEADVAFVPAAHRGDVGPGDEVTGLNGYLDFVGLPQGPPFNDPRVRLAMSLALDRSTVTATRVPARGFVPPFTACGDRTPAHADVARARALLQEAKADLGGVALDFFYNDDFGNRALAEQVARQWHGALGLQVTLRATDVRGLEDHAASPQGFTGAFHMGWQPPVAGPESYIGPLFTSAGIGTDNFSRFADPAVQRALDREARSAAADDERRLAYARVEQQLCNALPMIPLTAGQSSWAIRASRVGGAGRATLDGADGEPVLRELYVKGRST
jgi:oligopeptide transport system substrate-binding protein